MVGWEPCFPSFQVGAGLALPSPLFNLQVFRFGLNLSHFCFGCETDGALGVTLSRTL